MHGLEHSVLLELDVQVLVPHARRLLEAVECLVAAVAVSLFVDDLDDMINIREEERPLDVELETDHVEVRCHSQH